MKYMYDDVLNKVDTILYWHVAYQKTGHQNVDELGPETESTIEFVNNVNNIKKVVFSNMLEKVEDNAKIREINAEEISKMKQEPSKNLLLQGGTDLVSTFIQLGLWWISDWSHSDNFRSGKIFIQT